MTRDEAIRILHTTFRRDENISAAIIVLFREREHGYVDKMTGAVKGNALDDIKHLIGCRDVISELKILVDIFETLQMEAKTSQEMYAKSE